MQLKNVNLWRVLWTTATLAVAPFADAADVSLAPQHPWRMGLRSVVDGSHGASDAELAKLERGGDAVWTATIADDDAWIAFEFDESKLPERVMLTFSGAGPGPQLTVALEEAELPAGAPLDWPLANAAKYARLEAIAAKPTLQRFVVRPQPGRFYRLVVSPPANAEQPQRVELRDLGLYDLSGAQRKDYWLIIGASIQAQSIRQSVFNPMAREKFASADPVVFNLAVSGWRTEDLRRALPDFLEAHPEASYVGVHIGGNNVSAHRPYPGGAETVQADLEAILTLIRDAGKIPILSRLSYRAYHGDRPVPPEENGSGPYVANIYDPLIAKYCPRFFDEGAGRGVVDPYTYFKEHPDELAPDGIHVKPSGAQAWNRLWVEQAGAILYGSAPK